jgi:hypothetical protein
MKIKKFNNLWTMGLIIFIGILLVVYLAKLINPAFVVGVAETESIVKLGQYIDSHKWAYYLAGTIISFAVSYLFCCACCRKKYLNWKESIIVLISVILLFVSEKYLTFIHYEINMLSSFILPSIILLMTKTISQLYDFLPTKSPIFKKITILVYGDFLYFVLVM